MKMNRNNTDFRTRPLTDLLFSSEIRQCCFVCPSQYLGDCCIFLNKNPEVHDPMHCNDVASSEDPQARP